MNKYEYNLCMIRFQKKFHLVVIKFHLGVICHGTDLKHEQSNPALRTPHFYGDFLCLPPRLVYITIQSFHNTSTTVLHISGSILRSKS